MEGCASYPDNLQGLKKFRNALRSARGRPYPAALSKPRREPTKKGGYGHIGAARGLPAHAGQHASSSGTTKSAAPCQKTKSSSASASDGSPPWAIVMSSTSSTTTFTLLMRFPSCSHRRWLKRPCKETFDPCLK